MEGTDPCRVGSNWISLTSFVSAAKEMAERKGFKLHKMYRASTPTKVKMVCPHVQGETKCSYFILLSKIKQEEKMDDCEWFVASSCTQHYGHSPTPLDPRQMTKAEEKAFSLGFAHLKASSPAVQRRSSAPLPAGHGPVTRSTSFGHALIYEEPINGRSDEEMTHVSLASEPHGSVASGLTGQTGPRIDELHHLHAESSIEDFICTLDLPFEYSGYLRSVDIENIRDLLWLSIEDLRYLFASELRPSIPAIHSGRIISALRVLEPALGRPSRVKIEETD